MSYQVYTTSAYIIERIPVGEADLDLRIVSETHGIIWVRVAGNRKITSKMRMHSSLYSLVKISVVHGRLWRVTGLEALESCHLWQTDAMPVIARVCQMIKILHKGEIANAEVFHLMENILRVPYEDIVSIKGYEIWCMIQVLDCYGYWDRGDADVSGKSSPEMFVLLEKESRNLVTLINKAMYESQLIK